MESLRRKLPESLVFSFGVYEESNYIFHSVTGVAAGYFLRRRPPDQLFDPIRQLAREPGLSARALMRQIGKYFQSSQNELNSEPSTFTSALTTFCPTWDKRLYLRARPQRPMWLAT